jgi:uncharacterized protein VcgC/VcgE DUF2780
MSRVFLSRVGSLLVASSISLSPAFAQAQKAPAASTAEIAAKALSPELIGLLTSKTGVTTKQAEGGAGAIFGYAKGKMKPDDFSKVSKAVPDMDGLLKAAPAAEPAKGGTAGALSGAASAVGGTAGTVAALAPQFQKLGLNTETVGKFVPVVVDYVTKKGGSSVGSLLGSVLK